MKKRKNNEPLFHKTIPALRAYIERVGAEEMNFKRYMIKEYKGHYYAERALIRIDKNGNITCTNKEYAPTKEEAEAIKAALVTEKFPTSILASNIDELVKLVPGTSTLHEFHSRKDKGIIMVQERRVVSDGTKHYLPWTFFSDGAWRMMEPDGLLPFWKPEPSKLKKLRIMIHEGAKAASFVHSSLKDPHWKHPWRSDLEKYEHWGMIGGALSPHRTDYEELRRERPLEVVYICDNDWLGKAALQEISRMYGQSMKGVMFDKRWTGSWDLADPMPEKLFAKDGRYIGPSLAVLSKPATRATEKVPNPEGKGPPIAQLRRPFREEWFHCVTPEVFVHRDFPNRILNAGEFNSDMAPYSDVDDTARLLKKDGASKTTVLKYSPAQQSGIYEANDGARYINTHVSSHIVPAKGDPKPFLEFMDHLIVEDKDRLELMRWCATLIARPEIKMLYGVLLISETQGVGKGTLGEKILAPIIGEHNVSYPSENEIVESNFNYWLAHKRLAVVHEIYAGHSAKAYNRLKSVVTDRYITVNKKYQASYDIENWMHIFACSNSMRAIQLSGDDRRWFVPKITEEKKKPQWWMNLNKWIEEENGLAIIAWWAQDFIKHNAPVLRGDAAPWSSLKKEVVEEGYSPGMTLVAGFLNRVKEEMVDPKWVEAYCKPGHVNGNWSPNGVVLLDTDLVNLIRNIIYDGRPTDRLEKPLTIRKVAKTEGWHISEHKARTDRWGTRTLSCRLICSTPSLAEASINDLAEKIRPIDVEKLAQDWKL